MGLPLDALAEEVSALHERLEQVTYYDVLGLGAHADYVSVRDAFYDRAQRFHPDRFVFFEEEAVKKSAYSVYKRMTEAYNVLSDPELRRRYDEALAEGTWRLPPEQRGRRLDAQERRVSSVFARIYLRSARAKLESGDLLGAGIDAELGLSLEDAGPLREIRDETIRRMARPDLEEGSS